jgi:hypothetical protein
MKKLLSIMLILISFNVLSQQTHTCTCTYISAIEWDLAGSDITFKNKPGDTLSLVTLINQDLRKEFEKEFWNEDATDQVNGGINKTVAQHIGQTYLVIYKTIDGQDEGGTREYNQVISFKHL